ncbi:MAG: hypothetical protein RL005_894, partial [Planctomycetota bacterium]
MRKDPMTNGPADPLEEYLLNLTRRRFFGKVAGSLGAALGGAALADLALTRGALAGSVSSEAAGILANVPHYAPRAKRVIYLHMEGAPSQLDLYDHKPELVDRFDQDLPDSVRN